MYVYGFCILDDYRSDIGDYEERWNTSTFGRKIDLLRTQFNFL